MTLAPTDQQCALGIEVNPSFPIPSVAVARNAYGAAAQEIVCRAMKLDPIRNAVKAGALYLAEKDRISRNQAEIGYTAAQFQYGNTHTKYLGCISLINRLTPEIPAPVSVEITQAHVERAAAAIANARAGRRGAPPIKNVLDILPPKLKAEVIEDAEAALVAAFTRLPPNIQVTNSAPTTNQLPK